MQQPLPTPHSRTPRTLCLPSEDPLLYLEPADVSNYFVPSHLLEQQFTRSNKQKKEGKVDLSEDLSAKSSERPLLADSCKPSGLSSNVMSSEDSTAILFDLYGKLSDPGLYSLDISLADTQSLCVATAVRQQQLAGALRSSQAADCMLSPPYHPMSAELKDFTTSDPMTRMTISGVRRSCFNDEERVIDVSVLTDSIFPTAEEEEDHQNHHQHQNLQQQKSSPSSKVNNTPEIPSISAKNTSKTSTVSARKYTRKRAFNELDSKQPPDKVFEGGGESPKDCDETPDRLALKRIRNTEAARRSRERKAMELQTLKEKLDQTNEECTYWRTRYESKSHAAEQREKELVERVKELEALLARIVTSQVPS